MKKLLPFLLATLFFVCMFTISAFAQDSTSITAGGVASLLPGKVSYWLAGLLALYELLVRYIPTVKSLSILTWIVRALRFVVPDKSGGVKDHV